MKMLALKLIRSASSELVKDTLFVVIVLLLVVISVCFIALILV